MSIPYFSSGKALRMLSTPFIFMHCLNLLRYSSSESIRVQPQTGKPYGYIRFNTLSLPMFNEFHALFYGPPGLRTKGPQSLGRGGAEGNGTKIVPLNLGAPYLTITRLLGEYNA